MFHAIGVGARKNADATITVAVKILNDAGALVAKGEYTGKNLNDVKAQIAADLQAKKDALTDATLQAAVVDQELASL